MDTETRDVLEAALHDLTTLNGLIASDGLAAFGNALADGCDLNDAWDRFEEQTFKIDNAKTIARLLSVLGPPDTQSQIQEEK